MFYLALFLFLLGLVKTLLTLLLLLNQPDERQNMWTNLDFYPVCYALKSLFLEGNQFYGTREEGFVGCDCKCGNIFYN